jgi:hypothetical protein
MIEASLLAPFRRAESGDGSLRKSDSICAARKLLLGQASCSNDRGFQMNAEQHWLKLYQLAALETDWSMLEDRIRATETAIQQRLHELSLDHGGTSEENLAIVDTVQKLNSLRGELTRWRESEQAGSGTRPVSE